MAKSVVRLSRLIDEIIWPYMLPQTRSILSILAYIVNEKKQLTGSVTNAIYFAPRILFRLWCLLFPLWLVIDVCVLFFLRCILVLFLNQQIKCHDKKYLGYIFNSPREPDVMYQ